MDKTVINVISLCNLLLLLAMDVSNDLTELGQIPMMIVCAGIKSLLDIPRTLQVLVCQVTEVFSTSIAIGD